MRISDWSSDVCSSDLGNQVQTINQDGTAVNATGTSFAAPQVSGAAALLAQAFPNLTGAQIVDLLFSSAADLGVAGTDSTFGRGKLSLTKAFQPQGQTSLASTAAPLSDRKSTRLNSSH